MATRVVYYNQAEYEIQQLSVGVRGSILQTLILVHPKKSFSSILFQACGL